MNLNPTRGEKQNDISSSTEKNNNNDSMMGEPPSPSWNDINLNFRDSSSSSNRSSHDEYPPPLSPTNSIHSTNIISNTTSTKRHISQTLLQKWKREQRERKSIPTITPTNQQGESSSSDESNSHEPLLSPSSTRQQQHQQDRLDVAVMKDHRSESSSNSTASSSSSSSSSSSYTRVWYKDQVEEYTKFAMECQRLKQYDVSIEYFNKVLELHIKVQGPVHSSVASTHHNLGILYTHLHQESNAMNQFRHAARIGRLAWGPDHLYVALSLVRIGFLLLASNSSEKGRDSHAIITFKEVLRIRLLHPSEIVLILKAYRYVAMAYTNIDPNKACQYLRKSRNHSTQMKEVQLEIAASWVQEGQISKNYEHFQKAHDIYNRILGPEHELTIQTQSWYQYYQDQEEMQIQQQQQPQSPSGTSSVHTSTTTQQERDQIQEGNLLFSQPLQKSRPITPSPPTLPLSSQIQKQKQTSIWVSPHIIPAIVTPTREKKESHFNKKNYPDSVINSPSDSSTVSTMSQNYVPIMHTPTSTKIPLTSARKQNNDQYDDIADSSDYEGEESCMLSPKSHHQQYQEPDDHDNDQHSIMVVRPDDESMSCEGDGSISIPNILQKNKSPFKKQVVEVGYNDNGIYDEDDEEFQDEEGLFPPTPSSHKKKSTVIEQDQQGLLKKMLIQPNNYDADELHLMASRCVKSNQLQEAVVLFTNLLQIMKAKYGELHERVGATYHNLGIVYLRQDEYEISLESFQLAVWKRQGSLGRNHPSVAISLVKVGIVQLLQHRLEDALFTFQRALQIRRQALGHLHPSIARIYNNIGCVHVEFQQFAQARRAFESSLDIQRNALVDKPDHGPLLFGVSTTLCNLGFLYTRQLLLDKAQIVFADAISFQQAVLGPHHKTVLSTMDSYADACAKNNQIQHAIQCYLQIVYELQTKTNKVTPQKWKACAVLYYKMSRLHQHQKDGDAALQKLRFAKKCIQNSIQLSPTNNHRSYQNLQNRIDNDLQQTEEALSKNNLYWI